MTTEGKKIKTASGVVLGAFIGSFASRYIDKSLAFPFPIDMALLLLSGIILFLIAYRIAGDLPN